MQFDPTAAKYAYAEKETDDLIRIAYSEEEYVDQAKQLARDELARRGFGRIDSEDIDRVRHTIEIWRREDQERDLRGLETDEEIPAWRQKIRSRLAPLRTALSVLALGVFCFFLINSLLGWNVFELGDRKSRAVALLVFLLWLVFVAPTRQEFRDRLNAAAIARKQ